MTKPEVPTVVVQLPSFLRAAKGLLTDDETSEIVNAVAADPEAGDVIEGTGGMRKLRFGLSGRGKRGGVRVIYYFHNYEMPTYLLTVYAKNRKDNLTDAEVNQLRNRGEVLISEWAEYLRQVSLNRLR